ncbi:alpha/beta fold hydrolase [Euzebya sp.]|uniref:alpha/beta fold hydrolase n=1 Tax=Euzebya sp. TaxID=1971409 RepID=UPI0035177473
MTMTAQLLDTAVGPVNVRTDGRTAGEPVVFVHGNLSDARIFDEQADLLGEGFRAVAVDQRGFGSTPPRPVDATRGVRDLADDVTAAIDALDLGPVHLVGHSMGGGVVMQIALDRPEAVRSLTLVAPISPYGFGATLPDGSPTTPDFAGSGGGGANPELVRLMREQERGGDHPASPRSVTRSIFFPSPDDIRDEDLIVDGILAAAVGDDHYPGDSVPSDNWPGVAPGDRGILNAISPKHFDLSGFGTAGLAVPVLWVHGAADMVVNERSMLDFGTLGEDGAVPGWPGADVHPPQPMVTQMRAVLERHAAGGATVREEGWTDAGHFIFTQHPHRFAELLADHLQAAARPEPAS